MRRIPDVRQVDRGQMLTRAGHIERVAETGRRLGQRRRAGQQGQHQFGHAYAPGPACCGRFEREREQQRFQPDDLGQRGPHRPVVEHPGQRAQAQVTAGRRVAGQREPLEPHPGERPQGSGNRRRRRVRPVLGLLHQVHQDGQIQRPLAGEVRVHRAAGQVGPLGDPVHFGVGVAVLGELLGRRGQHRGAGALLLLRPSQPDHAAPFLDGPGYDTLRIQMFKTSG
jgi:hypothetical protein